MKRKMTIREGKLINEEQKNCVDNSLGKIHEYITVPKFCDSNMQILRENWKLYVEKSQSRSYFLVRDGRYKQSSPSV